MLQIPDRPLTIRKQSNKLIFMLIITLYEKLKWWILKVCDSGNNLCSFRNISFILILKDISSLVFEVIMKEVRFHPVLILLIGHSAVLRIFMGVSICSVDLNFLLIRKTFHIPSHCIYKISISHVLFSWIFYSSPFAYRKNCNHLHPVSENMNLIFRKTRSQHALLLDELLDLSSKRNIS